MDFILSMIICEVLYAKHLKYTIYVFAATGILILEYQLVFLTFHSYVAKFTYSTLANCYLY